jgi:hypothetical protein
VWLSLVERCVRDAEVAGSNPVTPISLHSHCNHVVVALTSNELIRLLTTTYVENQCDGLFLPLIDNLGVKLLVPRIVAAIENR